MLRVINVCCRSINFTSSSNLLLDYLVKSWPFTKHSIHITLYFYSPTRNWSLIKIVGFGLCLLRWWCWPMLFPLAFPMYHSVASLFTSKHRKKKMKINFTHSTGLWNWIFLNIINILYRLMRTHARTHSLLNKICEWFIDDGNWQPHACITLAVSGWFHSSSYFRSIRLRVRLAHNS